MFAYFIDRQNWLILGAYWPEQRDENLYAGEAQPPFFYSLMTYLMLISTDHSLDQVFFLY